MSMRRRQGATGCLVAFVVLALAVFLTVVWLGVGIGVRDGRLVVEIRRDSVLSGVKERRTPRRKRNASKKKSREGSASDNLYDARGGLADLSELGYLGKRLEAGERDVYLQLYRAVADGYEDVELDGVDDADAVQRLWLCVLDDHPELFWLDGSFSYTVDDRHQRMILQFGLSTPIDEVEALEEQVEERAEAFMHTLPSDASDYDIALKAYEYVIERTTYAQGSPNDQNILSVLVADKSVCAGYARAYQYLLQRAGLPCALVRGTAEAAGSNGENHVWNLISVDGVNAYVDPSWGDRNPQTEDGDNPEWGEIRYAYFGMTTEEAVETGHAFEHPDWWPRCTSHELNYYQRQEMLLDAYGREEFQDLVLECIDEGETEMECQFVDAQGYEDCRRDLREGGCLQELPSWLGVERARWSLISNDTTRTMRLSWTVE